MLRKRKTCLERSRYGLGIVNVSARQAALIRWTATDKLDMKNGFSGVSRHISQTPSDLCQEFISTTLIRPRVSWAIGKKSWVRQSELYLFVFLTAAIFIYLFICVIWNSYASIAVVVVNVDPVISVETVWDHVRRDPFCAVRTTLRH